MGPETYLRYPFKVTRGLLYIKPPTFLGPKWLDASSQGQKKSQFPGPNPISLALEMDAARIKSITRGAL